MRGDIPPILVWLALLTAGLSAGCNTSESDHVTGYVEGEYVYVSSALGGTLETLPVQRGDRVQAGALLFLLDDAPQQAAKDEAERRLAQSRARLDDARKGQRPSEIESLNAQLQQARAVLSQAESDLGRQESLARAKANTTEDLDRARSAYEQAEQHVAQLKADLETAQLGARTDQVRAAEADVHAMEAALVRTEWDLRQMRQSAPQAGVVFDTLYRQGEWVPAGHPVVALLPPENIKVRAFVPQDRIATIQPGQTARVAVDGVPQAFAGRVSFISPDAEFTPPVIYSRESRDKLVFLVEIRFDVEVAAKLHPGQPVEVHFDAAAAQ